MSDLETRQQIEPIIGYKDVRIKFANGRPVVSGMRGDYSGALEVAKCAAYPTRKDEHSAATVDCTCGFYAYDEPSRMYSPQFLATVELFGTVLVHEKGFRATHQRLIEVKVKGECEFCSSFSDTRRGADALYFGVGGDVHVLCADHGELSERLNAAMGVTLQSLESLGVKFEWRA